MAFKKTPPKYRNPEPSLVIRFLTWLLSKLVALHVIGRREDNEHD